MSITVETAANGPVPRAKPAWLNREATCSWIT